MIRSAFLLLSVALAFELLFVGCAPGEGPASAGIPAPLVAAPVAAKSAVKESAPQANSGPSDKLALLVGCTEYRKSQNKIRELYGPRNDIPIVKKLLVEQFGFAPGDITTLVGWPSDERQRPTRANIAAAFEQLIARAAPNSQVMILISGHGTQVPAVNDDGTLSDPTELDGLDEVFLPADVEPWKDGHLPNSIRDNEFGAWLDQLKGKGADVWVVFDCCHSGTMMRSIETDEPVERSRRVRPDELQIPALSNNFKPTGGEILRSVDHGSSAETPRGAVATSKLGSVAEFYAAQAFEEAPELPRPIDAPRNPDHYFGLFSYVLVQVLQHQHAPLNYAELSQAIISAYRAERGSRGPTPVFAGDLDRQVLGTTVWPKQDDCLLMLGDAGLSVTAGAVHGVTTGSVLAVMPPAGDERARDTILGYVRVTEALPSRATVEPCPYREQPAVEASKLPDLARCKVVFRDLGDMAVKVAVYSRGADAQTLAADITAALKALPTDIQPLVEVVKQPDEAQWVLDVASPADAKQIYQRDAKGPAVYLVQQLLEPVAQMKSPSDAQADAPRVFASYTASGEKQAQRVERLASLLAPDMQKLFTWQNVWRVANQSGGAGQQDLELQVKLTKPVGRTAPTGEPTTLFPGERIEVRLKNAGAIDWWFTLLQLDGNYGIAEWAHGSIKAYSELRPLSARVNDKTLGSEGVVVFAIPLEQQKTEPRFSFLAQSELGQTSRGGVEKARGPETPFEKLLGGAGIGKGTRGIEPEAPDQPTVLLRTWTTLPSSGR